MSLINDVPDSCSEAFVTTMDSGTEEGNIEVEENAEVIIIILLISDLRLYNKPSPSRKISFLRSGTWILLHAKSVFRLLAEDVFLI